MRWACRIADPDPHKNTICGIVPPFSKPALSPFSTTKVGESAEKDGQTLLVPTNAAFDKLPEDLNGRLLADKEFAQKVVQRHILDEVFSWSMKKTFLHLFQVLCCSGIAKNNIFFNNSRRRAGAGQVSVSADIVVKYPYSVIWDILSVQLPYVFLYLHENLRYGGQQVAICTQTKLRSASVT